VINDNLRDFLLLCSIPRLGSHRVRNLVQRFKYPKRIFNASVRELVQVDGIEKSLAERIKNGGDLEFVAQQLDLIQKNKVEIMSFWHPDFPVSLKNIYDPPIMLYIKGNTQCLQKESIAVVGTRAPSTYGKIITEKYVTELAKNKIAVVSGLARGVDTIAHQTSVKYEGATIAVLGSGLDKIYPGENALLAEQICENGLLVSEFVMGKGPDAMNFPRRNRIIAGISKCTLVIEAGNKSGSLITADFALDQGKEVFSVPGNVNSRNSIGTNKLIQQGATPALDINEIIQYVSPCQNHTKSSRPLPRLSKSEEKIYTLLDTEPQHIDVISQKSGLATSQVLAILLSLELKSVIKQISGKHFLIA